jgi:hypothetical protein
MECLRQQEEKAARRTNTLPHRQAWSNNILRVHKENVTDIEVIGRYEYTAQLLISIVVLIQQNQQ